LITNVKEFVTGATMAIAVMSWEEDGEFVIRSKDGEVSVKDKTPEFAELKFVEAYNQWLYKVVNVYREATGKPPLPVLEQIVPEPA
jgi:hypothetical protein